MLFVFIKMCKLFSTTEPVNGQSKRHKQLSYYRPLSLLSLTLSVLCVYVQGISWWTWLAFFITARTARKTMALWNTFSCPHMSVFIVSGSRRPHSNYSEDSGAWSELVLNSVKTQVSEHLKYSSTRIHSEALQLPYCTLCGVTCRIVPYQCFPNWGARTSRGARAVPLGFGKKCRPSTDILYKKYMFIYM